EGLDHLRKPLHQPGRGHPVVRRPLGQAEAAAKEIEEAGVSELYPAPLLVEVRKSEEEVGHGPLLAPEQSGEPFSEIACVRHASRFAEGSDNQPSPTIFRWSTALNAI